MRCCSTLTAIYQLNRPKHSFRFGHKYWKHLLLQTFLLKYFRIIQYTFRKPFRYIRQSYSEFVVLPVLENHFRLTNDAQILWTIVFALLPYLVFLDNHLNRNNEKNRVCISSISTITPSFVLPNSYLVSTKINPRLAAISVPLWNKARVYFSKTK
jgi:hypothetical protein